MAPEEEKPRWGEYERPDFPYRCGREAFWKKPCAEGPNPDGTCPRDEAPCRPTSTLRVLRGRATLLAAAAAAALLVILLPRAGSKGPRVNSMDPGPLSPAHARFVGQGSCRSCHEPRHGGLSENCLQCHAFAGESRLAHNTAFPKRQDLGVLSCSQCHHEHKGAAATAGFTDAQCQSCHLVRFHGFADGHPEFPPDYPKPGRAAVRFDHRAHFDAHFKDPAFKAKAPGSCAACHDLAAAGKMVPPMGFDRACASCHAGQTRGDMVVLRIPPDKSAAEVSEASPAQGYLLKADKKDAKGYAERTAKLVAAIAQSGRGPLAAAIEERAQVPSGPLLAGLAPQRLSRVPKAVMEGHEPKADAEPSAGWFWNEDMALELRYRPVGHADPVARAWLELASKPGAKDLRLKLFDPKEGLGNCAKCHAPGGWLASGASQRPFHRFSHAPHLRLMDCRACHAMKAAVAAVRDPERPRGDFAAIKKESCSRCHGEGMVRQDCRLCHFFHRGPSLRAPGRRAAERPPQASRETSPSLGTAMQVRQEPSSGR